MKKKSLLIPFIFLFFSLSVQTSEVKQATKSVKKFVGFIRYEKNQKAIQLIDIGEFSKNISKNFYQKLTNQQKKSLENSVSQYIQKKVFTKAVKYFSKVNLIFGKPKILQDRIHIPTSILYKTKEKITFSWLLHKKKNQYVIVDFVLENGKLASKINQKQAEKLYNKKGADYLIQTIKKISN